MSDKISGPCPICGFLHEARHCPKKAQSSFDAPSGYTAPICPRCFHAKSLGQMKQDASTLDWRCAECQTNWSDLYLQGWNDGHRAAQYNDRTERSAGNAGRPQPTLRPWKPEEVPLGAIIRTKGNEFKWRALIGYVGSNGQILGAGNLSVSCDFALHNHEHSLDGGKTWKPCGVEE